MINDGALAEAALTAGLRPVQLEDRTEWTLPGQPGLELRSPYVLPLVRSWLMADLVASGDIDQLLGFNRMALRLDPRAIYTGLHWQGDVWTVVCCMVALGHWTEGYALSLMGIQRTARAEGARLD
jgi:hypothetical protein